MTIAISTDQKTLRAFIERRHPEYHDNVAHWTFCEETYKGGREWFNTNLHRHRKEGEEDFAQRIRRAYRFNHTREVVDLVQKYIFKAKIERAADAPVEIVDFWENVTRSGLDIAQFMQLVSAMSSVYGSIWIFTDSSLKTKTITVADAKKSKERVYAYLVKPIDVLDVGFAPDGGLNWVLVRERKRDDSHPIESSGEVIIQYRLWTRTDWYLFREETEKIGAKEETLVKLVETGDNPLGEVPGFRVDHIIGETRYTGPGLINDIAYLDRAVANYLSNLDEIIQDQTFSQLVMPAQGKMPGEDDYNALLAMGTKRVFIYDGEGGSRPEYISPDPKQAGVILQVINKIIAEIYHSVGLAGERTKQDNAVGIDNSSGVAKAYDFERVNSLLATKADSLENAENRLVAMVLKWNSKDEPERELVKYSDTFDVRSLFDEFTIAERLAVIKAPDEVRREQMKQVVDKLFPRLAADLRTGMEREIRSWPSKSDELGTGAASDPARRNPQTQNRQGQVTKMTD